MADNADVWYEAEEWETDDDTFAMFLEETLSAPGMCINMICHENQYILSVQF